MMNEVLAAYEKYGFVGRLAKPFTVSDLSLALDRALKADSRTSV
jgi:hypothetical protein